MKTNNFHVILLIVLMALSSNVLLAQVPCSTYSPLLNSGESNGPCNACGNCNIPENLPMDTVMAHYDAKSNDSYVFGKIKKSELTVHTDYGSLDTGHLEINLKGFASYMGEQMDIKKMIECVNVNCFFSNDLLLSLTRAQINEHSETQINNSEYDAIMDFIRSHNMDSIAAEYICGNNSSLFADSDTTDCPYSIGCTGGLFDTIVPSLETRSAPNDPKNAELDIFSNQLAGLAATENFPSASSPEIKGMLAAVNSDVELYNGLPNIGLSLTALNSLDLSVPVSISNNGAGVKINDYSGDIGMNWDMSAAPVIRRVMKGLPDEFDGESTGKGIGIVPMISPCMRLSGAGISIEVPVPTIGYSIFEPNVVHIRPTIASFVVYGIIVYINLDFTAEIAIKNKPDIVVYKEHGVGYLRASHNFMSNNYDVDGELDVNRMVEDYGDYTQREIIEATSGNKKINDWRFLSPMFSRAYSWLQGIENLFGNVTEKSQKVDYEPDEFIYSEEGYSGKFQLNWENHYVLQIPQNNVIIKPYFANPYNNENLLYFTIQTPEGHLYKFGDENNNGVDFTTMTNYALPVTYTYPELDTNKTQLLAAKLADNSSPSQVTSFCWPNVKEYGDTYESGFTIKDSPRYKSAWHVTKLKSLVTNDSILFEYAIDSFSYMSAKNLTHEFPNFDYNGTNFVPQPDPDKGAINEIVNSFNHIATEWQFGRASLLYSATENHELRNRISKISGNCGEEIQFVYRDEDYDIIGKKYCKEVRHYKDSRFYKGWEFRPKLSNKKPDTYTCDGDITKPYISMPKEWGYNLGEVHPKKPFEFGENFYLNVYTYTIYVPFVENSSRLRIPNKNKLTEFGSLVQVKSFVDALDLSSEVAKFNAEDVRLFIESIAEIDTLEGRTDILKLEYENASELDNIPKRFSTQQDLWGYWNTNPSGSLMPKIKYKSFNGNIVECNAHYGFTSKEPSFDVTLGHNEEQDFNKAKTGLVRKIINEYQGSVLFDYEPNQWIVNNIMKSGAGMRVREKREIANPNNVKVTQYIYENPVYINTPVRLFQNPFKCSDYDKYGNHLEKYVTVSTSPQNDWQMCKSNYIGYEKVTEKWPGNGKTVHYFMPLTIQSDSVKHFTTTHSFLNSFQINSIDEVNVFHLFKDKYARYPDDLGMETLIESFDEDNNLVERVELEYSKAYSCRSIKYDNSGFHAPNTEICRNYLLSIDQNRLNYPGPMRQNWLFSQVFSNTMNIFGESVGKVVQVIRTIIDAANPFREIIGHHVYSYRDITDQTAKNYLEKTTSTRFYRDGSSSWSSDIITFSNNFITYGTPYYFLLPTITNTLTSDNITRESRNYYPQNTTATDLKIATLVYDYLKNKSIYLPLKSITSINPKIRNRKKA